MPQEAQIMSFILEQKNEAINNCEHVFEFEDDCRQNACVFCSSGTTGKPKVINMPLLPFSNLSCSAKGKQILCSCKVVLHYSA